MTCAPPFNAKPGPINLVKAGASTIELSLDWESTALVAGSTIDTSDWTVYPSGQLAVSAGTITDLIVSTDLSGGDNGQLYEVTNTITAEGETLVQKFQVYVEAIPTIFRYEQCE